MPGWVGCESFGQYDHLMNSADLDSFIDKQAEAFLRDDLAMMPGFRAIGVPGDGNCLTHAVSKAIVGMELLYHALRQEIQTELMDHAEWYRQTIFPFFDDETAYEQINSAAAEAVPRASGDQEMLTMAEFLGPIHIHALANVLRRPIVLIAARPHWERALCGAYLPERLGPVRWTEAAKLAVDEAAGAFFALLPDGCDLKPALEAWRARVAALPVLAEDAQAEAVAVGRLTDDLVALLARFPPPEGCERASAQLQQAMKAARLRAPMFIAWASEALAHFCCVLPTSSTGSLPGGRLVVPREALPSRDGTLIVMGDNTESTALKYLEGGEWAVRGNSWPHREQFMAKLEHGWKEEHPGQDLQDTAVEQGWNIILPNLLNNVLDIAQLFKSLNAENDSDPVWWKIGSKVLVPRRVYTLAMRLPGLLNLLRQASDRMRPIWVTQPEENEVLTAGTDYTIKWGTLPQIAEMMEKKTGILLEDQKVELGWMLAGSGSFTANIAREVPFHTREHIWSIPPNFRPGRYWLSVRLLPFSEGFELEGAGPPGGSFVVVRGADAAPDVEDDLEEAAEWEVYERGEWATITASAAEQLNRHYQNKDKSCILSFDGTYVKIDFEQMRWIEGFSSLPIRIKGSDEREVDPDVLEDLRAMGFSESAATEALRATNNDPEMAAIWLMERPESADAEAPSRPGEVDAEADSDLEKGIGRLPPQIQRVLSREASTYHARHDPRAVCTAVDPSTIPIEETDCQPMLDERYLGELEREASLWKQVEERLANEDDSPSALWPGAQDGLHRAKSMGLSRLAVPESIPLSRVQSAPPVMSKMAWATLFGQAREHFAGACAPVAE
eukprot:CAMPEP_0117514366 /NCGR_PEP_ID=MMETSP0784-20121206/30031_1 /TAXON_ID=39447 /ORGANISM="" /LENGTH=841 /DNA_ID=CAMNT_0005310157 /DNA_START=1 /DNA_END=2526 /DNA_ORIENTATION=-